MIGSLLIAIILLWSAPVNADLTFKDYELVKNEEWFKTYIGGVGKGYFWANAHLEVKGQHPLYCQPGKLSLNHENYRQILDKYISEKHLLEGIIVELLLLLALGETFPCE